MFRYFRRLYLGSRPVLQSWCCSIGLADCCNTRCSQQHTTQLSTCAPSSSPGFILSYSSKCPTTRALRQKKLHKSEENIHGKVIPSLEPSEHTPYVKHIDLLTIHCHSVLCQQRKVKCDRNDPCANCTKARIECVSASNVPPKRRKKRFPEAELLARLRKYEAHLRNYGADVEAINREEAPPPLKEPLHHPKVTMQQLEAGYRSLSVRRSLKHVEKYVFLPCFGGIDADNDSNFWSGVNEEVCAKSLLFHAG